MRHTTAEEDESWPGGREEMIDLQVTRDMMQKMIEMQRYISHEESKRRNEGFGESC